MRKSFTRLSSFLVLLLLSVQMAFAAPTLVGTGGLSPADGATTATVTPVFTMTFQDNVVPGIGGTIGLYTAANVPLKVVQITGPTTDVSNGTVTFNGKTVTIAFKGVTYSQGAAYYVKVEGLAIKDAAGAPMVVATAFGGDDKWNFSIPDQTAPTIAATNGLSPADGANGVSTSATFSVNFSENVSFIAGYPAGLKLGDIAVYKATSAYDGEEGGDLVSLGLPTSVSITGSQLSFTWPAGTLQTSTKYYIRIKKDIIQDASGNKFAGINTNGGWDFSTKAIVEIDPAITAGATLGAPRAAGDLWTNDNFFIDFAADMYLSKNNIVSSTNLPASGITLVDNTGATIPVTITWDGATKTFKLDPYGTATTVLSAQSFTVAIAAGVVRDVDGNTNKAKSVTFARGDWTAPTITSLVTTNPSGTTFDILVKANEVCTVKYIVVKGRSNPLATVADVIGYTSIGGNTTTVGTTTFTHRTAGGDYTRTTGTTVVTADIVAEGFITINNTSLEVLERVINLPATNGQEYEVFAVAYDASNDGVYVPDYTNMGTSGKTPIVGNISNVTQYNAYTTDILMPTVWFDGDSAKVNNILLNKTKVDGTAAQLGRLAKKGKLYLNFNEGIRLANGNPIDGNTDIKTFLTVSNDGTAIGYTATISADKKQIIVVPDSSYKSNTEVVVTIAPTKIEDFAGNEFQPSNAALRDQDFLVEEYLPVLAWFDPATGDTEVEANCITVRYNDHIFAMRGDENPAGVLVRLNNDPASPQWVGKYFEIREGDENTADLSDPSIKNEFTFAVVYNEQAYETQVNICRTSGNWESETWYYVWSEGRMLDRNRNTVAAGAGTLVADRPAAPSVFNEITTTSNDNISVIFQYEDTKAPEITFFVESTSTVATALVNIDGRTDVAENERIGVHVNEYVTLGFADYIKFDNLTPGSAGLILDANAMRRYFKLMKGTEEVKFDIRDVVMTGGDSLVLYLDPYYTTATGIVEDPNFTAGQQYTVQFISTDKEGVDNGAYADDNKNWAVRESATFTCLAATVTPTVTVTYTPVAGSVVPTSTANIVFTFNQFHSGTVAPNIIFDEQSAAVPASIGGTIALNYQSATYSTGAPLNETTIYEVTVPAGSFIFTNGATWPAADSTWTFTTIDGTAPVVFDNGGGVLAFTPADDLTGVSTKTDLVVRFSEDILTATGFKLFLWETGVSEIFRIDAANVEHIGGDSIRVPNSMFGHLLKYDTDYHIVIQPGFVKDAAGNNFAGINDIQIWNFHTGLDPAPSYAAFSPKDETYNMSQDWSITFSEPVTPVATKQIWVYDTLNISNPIYSGNVTAVMTPSNGNKTYTLDVDALNLQWGNTYKVRLEYGAFVDVDLNESYVIRHNLSSTETVLGNAAPGVTQAQWIIDYNDNTKPTVKFWPAKPDTVHIAYNSYLYIQFSEAMALSDGSAIISDPTIMDQNVPSFVTLSKDAGTTTVPTLVEFVDNAKRTLRVTPLDPDGHNYTGDDNATLETETAYNLFIDNTFINTTTSVTYTLVDTAGNTFTPADVDFLTEDITAPDVTNVVTSAIDANSAKVGFDVDEAATVYVYVIPTPTTAPDAATVIANAQWSKVYAKDTIGAVTADIVLGETVGTKNYTAYVVAVDNEIDVYANPDPALWIFTSTNDGVDRIRDILPAPNKSAVAASDAFDTCDDDLPYVIAKSPAHLATNVAVASNIFLTFNENIAYNGDLAYTALDSLITLRKAKNNIKVDAVVTVINGDSIQINPVELLEEETSYYVEIDRYAVEDLAVCAANLATEWIGKENLYFTTIDNTAPVIDSTLPAMAATCVSNSLAQLKLYVTDSNPISKRGGADSLTIMIYRGTSSATGTLLEVIPVSDPRVATGVEGEKQIMTVDVSGFIFLPDMDYTVFVSDGTLQDSFGNITTYDYEWTFETIDNVPPVATWTLYDWNTYFNNSATSEVGIWKYLAEYTDGAAGATVASAPTHSVLKIDFDENIEVKTAPNKWVPLSAYSSTAVASYTGSTTDDILSKAEIFSVLKVGNLVYRETAYNQLTILSASANQLIVAFDTVRSNLLDVALLDAAQSEIDEAYIGSLMSNSTYAVTINAGSISDPINSSCTTQRIMNISEVPVVTLVTRDDTPPTLAISTCASGACVNAEGEITLTFNKPVVKSSYDIDWLQHESHTADNLMLTAADLSTAIADRYLELTKVSDGSVVAIKDITVAADMKTIKFKPATKLDSRGDYKIVFNKWTVKEYIENDPSGTLFEGDSCVFHVFDYLAPTVSVLDPLDNSTNIGSNRNSLSITFNEKIAKGAGTAKIRRENGQVFAEVSIAACTIDAAKTKLTIPLAPQTKLEDFTMYYVEMPAGFVTDTVACANGGNAFPGFSAQLGTDGNMVAAGWNFKTSDATPPQLLSNVEGELVGLFPAPGDSNVAKNSELILTFDENIRLIPEATAGLVIYYDNGLDVNNDFGNAIEFIPWNSNLITIMGSDIYNALDSNVVVVNPATVFDKLGTYYIRANGDNIKDHNNNLWTASTVELLDEVKDEEWKFTITNDVSPVLVATTPAYNGVTAPDTYIVLEDDNEGAVYTTLSMTFEDGNGNALKVAKGDPNKKLRIYEYVYNPVTLAWNDKLWLEMPISSESIVVTDNIVTVNDVKLRDGINGDSVYYVTVEPGAITNGFEGSQTFWPGISNGFRWRFQTASDDVFVGDMEIVSPNIVEDEDAARNLTIEVASELIARFDEGIKALANAAGRVKVYDNDKDVLVESVKVTADMIDGETLTVPLTQLYDETNFYVVIEAGAFGDTSTVPTLNPSFGGADVWTFHTGDNTEPVPTVVSPANDEECVVDALNIVLTYGKENNGIVANEGNLIFTDINGDEIASVVVAEPVIEGNIVTIAVTGLPDTTVVNVTIPEGFVLDGDAHSPMASPEYSWTFTTGENTAPTIVAVAPAIAQTADIELAFTFSEYVTAVAGKVVTINGVEFEADAFATTDNIVYTIALTELASEETYEIEIEEGAFVDVNEGCVANGIAATTRTFEVADILAPTADYYPEEAGDYRNLVLTIDFDDEVTAATGNVVIYNSVGEEVLSVPANEFKSTNGSTYTYTTSALSFGKFYVLIDEGAFEDKQAAPVGVEYAGISDSTEWTITIADPSFDNCYTIDAPKDGDTGIALSTNLVISFCTEMIKVGVNIFDANEAPFVTVAKQSNENQIFKFIEITADMISTNGKTLTIPVEGLEELTTYSVTIPASAIQDEAGNSFAGIIDANTWNFTTGDFTAPVVSVVAATVNNVTGTAAITSSEVGTVYLVETGVPTNATAIAAAIAAKKAVAATVTVANQEVSVSTEGLVAGTYQAVAFDLSNNSGVSADKVTVTAVESVSIAAIQGTGAASPYVDKVVTTVGVVSGKDANGFFMQDANAAWSGVYVYAPSIAATVGIGTGIKITGKVTEYFTLTEIKDVIASEFVAPVIVLDPVIVPAAEVAQEKWESVLVAVENNGLATAVDSYKEWTIVTNNNVTVKVDDQLFAFTPVAGDRYKVQGVVNFTFDEFKVAPRNDQDISKIVGTPAMGLAISVYPTVFENAINLKVSSNVVLTKAVFTNIAGQIVKEVINPENTISTSELRSGVYFISLHTVDGIAKTERIIKR